jgi:hypothetical protein
MKYAILLGSAWLPTLSAALVAAASPPQALPFAPDVISRLSLDGKPRSLAIRQGPDVWLGYDLPRAAVLKAWRAPPGKPGLVKSGFTTRSTGTTWFEDPSDADWVLQRGAASVPLAVRYLGCSQRKDHIELRWELRHDTGAVQLFERVPLDAAPAVDRVVRELRVEGLSPGESLLPPSTLRKAWKITPVPNSSVPNNSDPNAPAAGAPTPALRGTHPYRLTLP